MYITMLLKKTISIILSAALLLSLGSVTASAQIVPGEENFQPIGPVGTVSELERARDTVWNSILGRDGSASGPVDKVLENTSVLLSGLITVNGQEVLYIGIDEDDEEHNENINALKAAIKKEFPNVPVQIEPTGGVTSDAAPMQLSFNKTANISIPDNTGTQSVSSRITVPNNVTVDSMSVSVNITHTYIGDLKVTLVAPNGTEVTLHNRSGGADSNIYKTYTTELANLAGQSARGTWTLQVGDYANNDYGVLNSWGMVITPRATTLPTRTAIFSDGFAGGLGKWTTKAGGSSSNRNWVTKTLDESVSIEGESRSNIVAQAEGCAPTPCSITLKAPIDLTDHSSAYLSFHRFVDDALDNGEYLKVELGRNGVYTELDKWTPEDNEDDNKWHHESYDLSSYLTTSRFTIRFTTNQNLLNEEVAIDNVVINLQSPSSPLSKCLAAPDKNTPLVGGDRLITRTNTSTKPIYCGTIGLGGVKTKNGKEGFVTAAHNVEPGAGPAFGNTGIWVGHKIVGGVVHTPLGRVDTMPFIWDFVIDKNERLAANKNKSGTDTALADAAFVEYPQSTCARRWNPECFEYNYKKTVTPMRILNNNGNNYRVEQSQLPTVGLRVRSIGASTQRERSGSVASGKMLATSPNRPSFYLYLYTQNIAALGGDSGGPVYTTPVSGKVKMVGIHKGAIPAGGIVYGALVSWEDVAKTLNLEDL